MGAFIGSLLIFFARIVDVSVGTIRIIVLVRGKRFVAASLGFVEALVYILALGYVMDKLDNPINVVMYCLGFAAGNIVGSYIEERMAMGLISVQVITMTQPRELCEYLREMGFGVTTWEGRGREGRREVLNVTLLRKELDGLLKTIEDWDVKAFVTILDARATRGGVIHYPQRSIKKK
ncbi:MAG: DUF2179 domain-containing protein [Clostridia bacterium]|nr:DUF2179 domain-containing protein [Clostridia bacterium]